MLSNVIDPSPRFMNHQSSRKHRAFNVRSACIHCLDERIQFPDESAYDYFGPSQRQASLGISISK